MIYLHSLCITGDGYKLLGHDSGLRIGDWMKPVSVLIGENGSGKSTVLECLTWIFRALHERYVMGRPQAQPPFEFELMYNIMRDGVFNGGSIFFDPSKEGPTAEFSTTSLTRVRVTGKQKGKKYDLLMEHEEVEPTAGSWEGVWYKTTTEKYAALAPNLVVYYSGLSESIEGIYTAFEREYRTSLQKDARTSQDAYAKLRVFPLYYLERGHFELLLAALYSFEYSDDVDQFFARRLGIARSATRCVRIDIRQKIYKSRNAAEFWGAGGELGIFLERIRAYATEEITNPDQSLTFWFGLENWYGLRASYVEERLLFTLLLLLRSEELLAHLEVFYDLPGEAHVSHLHMSEGQQQLVTLRALNELMVGDNTLFLLDEPDTYLHPKWQAAFMQEIEPFTTRASFIITTHSPLLLANFRGGNLFIMKAGTARLIAGQYYGRTYGDSLRDMGAGTRPAETKQLFLKLFDMLDRSQWDAADEQLAELREMVGPDDTELVEAETMLDFMRPKETSESAE